MADRYWPPGERLKGSLAVGALMPGRKPLAEHDISASRALKALGGPGAHLGHVEVHPEVGSTNALALEDGREALLVIAIEQRSGRGRHGKSWRSPPGGLYMSYVPPGELVPERPSDISPLAALAVADAVDAVLVREGVRGAKATLKWPNDVVVGDGKVAGVLVQSSVAEGGAPRTVVGIGVNVNTVVHLDEGPTGGEWPAGPASLREVTGHPIGLQEVLVEVVARLVERLRKGLDAGDVGEFRDRCRTLGAPVAFTEGGRRVVGLAVDVSEDGCALLVRVDEGEVRRLTAGEVRHVRSGPV